MALEKYEEQGLLFNTNFLESAGDKVFGYRGELVLIEGEVADEKGRTKPPVALIRHAIMLDKDGKLVFVAGIIDQLELLNTFVDKYQGDFADGVSILLYVVNLTESMQVEMNGINFVLIPLTEGVAWNELVDELCMEKSDFKGQAPAEKIVTVYDEYKRYEPKYPAVEYDYAISKTADIKWETHGAV
jgi:hypothetical protein